MHSDREKKIIITTNLHSLPLYWPPSNTIITFVGRYYLSSLFSSSLCLCLSCFLQKLQAIILHTIHKPKHTLLFISIIKSLLKR